MASYFSVHINHTTTVEKYIRLTQGKKKILVLLACENNGLIVQEQMSCQSTAYKNHIQE